MGALDSDNEIARLLEERKEAMQAAKERALLGAQGMPKTHMFALKLKPKRPGLKALLGGNPLQDDPEFDELEKYFRLSKGRV